VLDAVNAAPVHPIGPAYLTTRDDLATPRLVVTGINAALDAAAAHFALFSELSLPWATPAPGRTHPES
jgi:hypothetical protein